MAQTKNKIHFVSIKWKYLIAFTLLLTIVNFGLAWQSSYSLKKQFSLSQQKNSAQSRQQLEGLLDSSYEQLVQTAYTIQLSLNVEILKPYEPNHLETRYEILNNHELEAIYLFTSNGIDQLVQGNHLPVNYKKLLAQVFKSELPHSDIFCQQSCSVFSFVPILQADGSTAVLYLSKSVAQLLENFYRISANNIALVSIEKQKIFAASHSQQVSKLVQKAIQTPINLSTKQKFSWQQQTYNLEYIKAHDKKNRFQFVIITDISENLAAIQGSTKNSMLYGGLGLLFSMLILLYMMAKPVSRIVFLSQHLPLLSSNRHDEFKDQVLSNHHRPLISDELDKLELTSIKLADQLQSSEKDLIWQAEHDTLTGLKNRHRFRQDFEQILNSAIRFRHEGALLYFDLDQFKYVNDTSGHKAGDVLLKLVAEQVKKIIRNTDVFARLGGDEFALILSETDEEGALKMANKIQENLSEISLPAQDYVHRTSASIGVVMFPQQGNNVEDLVAYGDIAMYNAKDDGRGNTHLFTESDSTREHIHSRLLWKDAIEKALHEKRLILYFQPIMNIQNRHISHHEVLLRLVNENGEIVPPGNFIPEAEQTGLINTIDFYVIKQAILYLSKSPDLQSKIAINLSGKTINDENLVSYIKELLYSFHVSAERIIFEVTETAAVADIVVASNIMEQINAIGCNFALDDFGIGFSSFYYLKKLPVEYIKIDGSFIRNIVNNPDDQLFVQAISKVISGLGKKTVAEFVEDDAALQLLNKFGVDYAQGYHIGKPQAEPLPSTRKDTTSTPSKPKPGRLSTINTGY